MFVTSKWKLLIVIFIVIIKQSLQCEGEGEAPELPPQPEINVQAHFEKREVHSLTDLNPVISTNESSTDPSDDQEAHQTPESSGATAFVNSETQDHSQSSASVDGMTLTELELQVHPEGSEGPSSLVPNAQAHSKEDEITVPDCQVSKTHDNKTVISITDLDLKLILDNIMRSHSNMIQADVEKGSYVNEQVDEAWKTFNSSTISYKNTTFQNLMTNWRKTSKRIKLHFKSTDAFVSVMPLMKTVLKGIKEDFQPWICGEILVGPGPGGTPSIEAHTFIENAKENFPDSMLSLGWTTMKRTNDDKYDETIDKYTMKNVKEMIQVLDDVNYKKPLNYEVRASYAANSLDELKFLLENNHLGSDNSTLTIVYNDENEIINYPKLVSVIREIGLNRIFLDVPNNVSEKIIKHYHQSTNVKKISSVSTAADLAETDWDLEKNGWKLFNV